jgi:cytochrome P450
LTSSTQIRLALKDILYFTMARFSWLYELARKPLPVKKEPNFFYDTSEVIVDKFQDASQVVVHKLREARQCAEEIDFEGMRYTIHGKMQNATDAATDFVVSLDPREISPDMIMPLAMAALVALVLVALLYRKRQLRIRHHKQYGENAFPPFAPCNSLETVSALTGPEQPWFFKQCAEMVGPVFRLHLPFTRAPMFVAIGDVETAKEILQDPDTVKPEPMYSSVASIAGGPNIVTSEGLHWKLSRKCLSPAFMKAHLDRMHRVCKDQTEIWIEKHLEPAIQSGDDFDIGEECMYLTISIICRAAFEYRIKDTEAKALMKDLEIVSKKYALDEIQNPLRKLMGSNRESAAAKDRIQAFAKKILSAHRKKSKIRRTSTAVVKDSIIGCIDKSQNYENDTHRIADIVMLLLSGHDTTAYTLAWILLELARNPNELKYLRDALGGSDDELAQQMLKDILREGMRLRPVSPGIGVRMIGKDFYLKDQAMVIPKGSHIMFPAMVLTRNGVDDAETFRPSRWTEHPDRTFLPFSTGKRNCVGQALALAEITWVLSRLCAKYDFEVVEEGKAEFTSTLKCVGARLRAHRYKRDGAQYQ